MQSCERIRTALDQLEIEKDVENFANEYGTGNLVSQPPDFTPSNGIGEPELPGSPIMRYTQHERVSKRPPIPYQDDPVQNPPHQPEQRIETTSAAPVLPPINGEARPVRNDMVNMNTTHPVSRTQTSPPQTSPPSHPPPPVPEMSNHPSALAPPKIITAAVNIATSSNPPPNAGPRNTNRVSQPLPVTPHGGDASRTPARVPTPPP